MPPDFAESPVPITIAAKVLGMVPDTVRNLMERGSLDIGVLIMPRKKKGNRRAYISPKKLYELTGYCWTKEKEQEYQKRRGVKK